MHHYQPGLSQHLPPHGQVAFVARGLLLHSHRPGSAACELLADHQAFPPQLTTSAPATLKPHAGVPILLELLHEDGERRAEIIGGMCQVIGAEVDPALGLEALGRSEHVLQQ